jgi:hypothetical protein
MPSVISPASAVSTLAIAVVYWVAASIAAYVAFNRALWRGSRGWAFIGVGYMLLAVIIQYVLQQIPGLVILIREMSLILSVKSITEINSLLLSLLKPYIPWLILYYGLMAGICQEIARYFAVKDREPASALYIGYGFALIDIAVGVLSLVSILVIARMGLLIVPFKNQLQALLTIQYVGIAVQPLVSFLFHPGASMFLRAMQANGRGLRGLATTTIAHTYVDSFTLYLNYILYGLLTVTGRLITASLMVYFSTIISMSIILFLIGLSRVRHLPAMPMIK